MPAAGDEESSPAAQGGLGTEPRTTPPADVAPSPGLSSFTDPFGDLTPSPLDPPPKYADLTGGQLRRSGSDFELRVRMGGSVGTAAPEGRTMNVASFFDVNGDGLVDYEIWANLADSGWGPSYFDNTSGGGGGFGPNARVAVEVAGQELVLRFPASHLGNSTSFRWATASEWGRYEVISTPAAARDDAPDNDGFARFTG